VAYLRFPGGLRYSVVLFAVSCAYGQQAPPEGGIKPKTASVDPRNKADKRAFGIFPNYRSIDSTAHYQPISTRQKWALTAQDSFDWPVFVVAAGLAGLGQMTNQNSSFGQGVKGYANRYVTIYGDLAIGNAFTEGVLPSLLHEDPRYFRRGTGGFWSRVGYATSRIIVTRTDSGRRRFNFSEIVGNSIAVGISNAYYPDGRTASQNFNKLTFQLGTDAFTNVMREFWPDAKRGLSRWRHNNKIDKTQGSIAATAAAIGSPGQRSASPRCGDPPDRETPGCASLGP